jgi:molybdenum cofactor biosynthesis enzyme MoaA
VPQEYAKLARSLLVGKPAEAGWHEGFVSVHCKHARLNWQSLALPDVRRPPFLILFINSLCNMKCEHCFYWQQLNQRDDLAFEEILSLSEIIKKNGVKEIYVPTNGYFADRTINAIRAASLAELANGVALINQKICVDSIRKYDIVFGIGPFG